MPDTKFSCIHCGQTISCDAGSAGARFDCPACRAAITVPESPTNFSPLKKDETGGVFISYRREGGEHLARLVMNALIQRGYKVFVDVESLKSGKFNTAILRNIEAAKDVVVIGSKGALDRCANEDDWVRQEIRHAFRCGKNVVVLQERNFVMPPRESLPTDIAELATCPALLPASENWDASMDRLVAQFLKGKPDSRRKRGAHAFSSFQLRAKVAGWIAGLALLITLICVPLIFNTHFTKKFRRLAPVARATVSLAVVCNSALAVGAWLSLKERPLGPGLVLAASVAAVAANLVCCYFFIKAASTYPQYKTGVPARDYLMWLINTVPYLVTAFLYRKGK